MPDQPQTSIESNTIEMVMALVAPVGVDKTFFINKLKSQLKEYDYRCVHIRISVLLNTEEIPPIPDFTGEYERIHNLMQAGNAARSEDPAILAKTAICKIWEERLSNPRQKENGADKVVYIIDAIKHHAELDLLQEVYGDGFYLIALSASLKSRENFLQKKRKTLAKSNALAQARKLIDLDSDDACGHGQEVSEFFHRSDYFIGDVANSDLVENSVDRFLKMIFNHPYVTPTFAEYAMHLAYVASTKSSDMSRQVGSVVSRNNSIISLGANDVPKSGGGTYWPTISQNGYISDFSGGRDYTNGYEANKAEINNIVDCVLIELQKTLPNVDVSKAESILKAAGITSLTEFGRMLHAEMDSLLDCSRRGVPTQGATMYVTTFPCHNCAKHIVGAGISEVIFIEPYQKSKALDLHPDSICNLENDSPEEGKVLFRPFVGLGPRYYMALFSMSISRGREKKRKGSDKVSVKDFVKKEATPRLIMESTSYLDRESQIAQEVASNS